MLMGFLVLLIAGCSTEPIADLLPDPVVEVRAATTTASATLDVATTAYESRELDGATVAGPVVIYVREHPHLARADFALANASGEVLARHDAASAPFEWTLDTTTLGDGTYGLNVTADYGRGRAKTTEATFAVANGGASEPTDPTEPEPTDPEPTDPEPTDPEPTDPGTFEAALFVSPTGSDANDGRSIDAPLRTVQRAADLAQPGDVIALRGGVYPIRVTFHRDGTADAPIRWTSYPGEWAILDGSDQTPVESTHKVTVTADWNVFERFEVRYGPQEGIVVNGGHDNVFRFLDVHGHHYSGILNYASDRNLYEDLRLHDNYDRYNPSGRIGDDADGISISTGSDNVLRRLLVYGNSDDGIDTWRSVRTLVDGAVAWGNGLGSHGNGNGIKAGGNSDAVYTIVQRSIAFDNRGHGFDDNSGRYVTFLNNTALNNGGYAYVAGETTTLRNNLAIGGVAGMWGSDSAHNGWDLGVDDANVAFVSTDPSSPDFLTLASWSPAIDAGTYVDLAYEGSAPDLGALGDGRTIAALSGGDTLVSGTTLIASAY
jgi:hypothetical protein